MTFNLRSLLVAAIVISNCITWTASRHHYNHNVQVHRIRHRRQGKGLYLPQSYIIPGGEGVGWGDWGVTSPCSRSCGGGVASQKRICLEFGPDGQTMCRGGDTRYFSCETHDCPPDAVDFRSEQCAKFNDKNFRGSKYSWVPYTNGPNPCELNCMPEGERFYFLHKKKVIDGTRCDENSFDVCVDGVCQNVGCDMKLGSSAREDKCRVCRGNGTNCHTIKGLIDQTMLTNNRATGYNDILAIPAGATTIVIEEVKPSKNYLALRNKEKKFFLNGDYQIDFPKSLVIAGAVWHYERSHTGYLAPDKLRCSGPTNETLILSILIQEENVGVEYEYSVPSELAPSLEKKYEWGLDTFSECNATCGGGFQTSNVTCRLSEDLEVVEDDLCDPDMKPASQQACNTDPCPPEWTVGPWSECSERCGDKGTRNRTVTCTQFIDGAASLVAENKCLRTLGNKPDLHEKCNTDASCPTWFIGEWKNCDKLIGEGKQTRMVQCYQEQDNRRIKLDDSECEEEKPETTKPCVLAIYGVDWIATEWTGCDTCSSTVKTRRVQCSNENGDVYEDRFCAHHPDRPTSEEPCKKEDLPSCEPMWYAAHWSKCSVECGEGFQTRRVFCGIYDNDTVTVVPDDKCAALPRYNDTKPCQVPQEKCPLRWYSGKWEKCIEGIQRRFSMCMRGNVTTAGCSSASMPVSSQYCDTDVTPVAGSQILDCEDDGNYIEIGVDSIGDSIDIIDTDFTTETTDFTSDGESPISFGSTDEVTTDTSIIDLDYDTTTDEAVINTSGSASSGTDTTNTGTPDSSLSEFSTTSTDLTGSTVTSGTDTTISSVAGSTDTVDTATEVSSSIDAVVTNTADSSLTSESSSASTDSGVTEASTTDAADKSTDVSSGSTDKSDTSSTSESSSLITNSSGVTDASSTDSADKTTEATNGSTDRSAISSTSPSSSSSTDNTGVTDASTTESTDKTAEISSSSTDKSSSSSKSASSSSITDITGVTDASTVENTDETTEISSSSTDKSSSSSASASSSSITDNTGVTDASTTDSTDETTEISSGSTDNTDSSSTSESSSLATDNTDETDTSSTDTADTTSEVSRSTIDESSSSSSTGSTDVSDASTSESSDTTTEVSSSSTDRPGSSSTSASSTDNTGVTDASTTESAGTTTEVSSVSTEATPTDKTDSSSPSESSSLTTGAGTTESTDSSTTSELSTEYTSATPESTTNIADATTENSGSSTDASTSDKTSSLLTSESGSSSTEYISSTDAATTESLSSSTESTASSTISDASTTEVVSTTLSGSSEKEDSSSTANAETATTSSDEITESSSESSTTLADVLSTEITTGEETTSSTESTSEVTETGTSSEFTTLSGSSTESEGTTTESTVSGLTTESVSSSIPWSTYITEAAKCRPRRKGCKYTLYGCCPDGKGVAKGPFDAGCNVTRTCKETEYKCCPDGVSPAQGPNNKGCPESHCEYSFYGCCLSDNKTEAQGNDQEGCPPPPPACKSSEFGCCADEETEATGQNGEGCPENETTETTESTEITSEEVTSSTEESSTTEESTTEESTTDESTTDESSTTEETSTTEEYSTEGSTTSTDITTISSSTLQEGCAGTTFGCCPDGVSAAEGEQNLGCCKSSLHGCCEDNITPAHGPQFEGCCLLTSFGCCPDNHKAAEGPHLEGCECQHALHGCCPDNVTIAQGSNNKGCGCQYTEFGCCPDRHTPASGPENEGCSCHTYQFGCCPDGVSVPEGPDFQGCECSRSKFGCCGDENTAATGPDGAGCDCSNSKYGCCLDGQSAATGPDFLGCETVPENRQAACGLPSESGPCINYELRWYYNTTYGGCTQFWYGGCDGNLNKFSSRDECEGVCVHPSPKDACNLPSVKGACDDNVIRWYFNSERKLCEQFAYGKCLGNDNNFETRELCQTQCDAAKITDTCKLPIEQGQCAGNFSRWGYNSESRRCEQFTWGGCEGNDNRFSSEAACKLRCDTPSTVCSEPQETGNCTDKEAVWSFSQTENRCMPFYYSGCDGNFNRFDSRNNCEQTCPSSYERDRCTLPTETGECRSYELKWFFDTSYQRCRQFYYGGCGGNENRFETLVECESACSEPFPTTTTTTTTSTSTSTTTTVRPLAPTVVTQPPREPDSFCYLEIDEGGLCEAAPVQTRYAYKHALGKCVEFQHQGCGGNQNSFESEESCMTYCHPIQDICQLPMKSGPCEGSIMSWFYDVYNDTCSQFTYGGCEGNENRFDTREQCEVTCRRSAPQLTVTTLAPTTPVTTLRPPAAALDEECSISSVLEQCVSSGEVWYFSTRERACVAHYNEASGRRCRNTGTFVSQDACEARCLTVTRAGVCQAQLDPGYSDVLVKTKYYYDLQSASCQSFTYGGIGGGPNRFSTIEFCNQLCSGAGPARECLHRVDLGENCTRQAVWRYFYTQEYFECRGFTYWGCGGNDNNFHTLEQCNQRCVPSGTGCDSYERQCRELRCLSVVRSATWDGCEACACDCEPYRQECDRIGCEHGVDKILDNGCERCVCRENPCASCNEYERCETSQITDPATGDIRYVSHCIELKSKPVVLPAPEPEVTSRVGGTARLRCLFHSNPPSRITWRRGEITIDRDVGRYSLSSDGTLEIVSLHHNDSGVYICIADNGLGIATQEINLVVEPLDCLVYESECALLRCETEVKYVPTADGCRRCECDCQPFDVECRSYESKCAGGLEKRPGPDGCTRCSCRLCGARACAEGERCVFEQYKNPYMPHLLKTVEECRQVSKPGLCPVDDTISNDIISNDIIPRIEECSDDADCRGVGKCCGRAGKLVCLEPAQSTTQRPVTTTHKPVDLPGPPAPLPQTEPEVTVREGGRASLRCLFHSNPPPRITWMRGAITIDGTVGRYRLLSDGTLEIVSLYRNDSGVYICIADNGLGVARQEVNLVVTDLKAVGIAGIENAVITGELNKRLEIRCLAYGNPTPSVFWNRGRQMVPFFNSIYEIRGNLLIIKRLTNDILGEYTCKAYNGQEATWVVTVQANMPQVVTQGPFVPPTRRPPHTTRGTSTTTSTTTTTERPLIFEEPVKVHLSTPYKTLSSGADLQLECELDGYPEPTAAWTKDRLPIENSNRISITGTGVVSRLTISSVAVSDSGLYGCHADNGYSSNAEYAQINIQQLTVPPNCVDNPFFANCSLIVHSRFCIHKYYSQFCCKSCVEAGMLDPLSVADLLADQPYRKK